MRKSPFQEPRKKTKKTIHDLGGSEHDIQKTILEFLNLKRIFSWRNNSGAVVAQNKNGSTRFFRYGAVGSPDVFAVKSGIIYGIEVKSKIGKQSPAQAEFQLGFEKAGGIYILARSLDDVVINLK